MTNLNDGVGHGRRILRDEWDAGKRITVRVDRSVAGAESARVPAIQPPAGLTSPVVPKIMRVMSRANVWIYRVTGGRVGGTWRVGSAFRKGVPVCLLTTIGRKSKLPRTTPLLYLRDGARVIVVASQGGLPQDPLWYSNLLAHPEVTVQIRSAVQKMRARPAPPDERAVLWPRLLALYADFAQYQSWTDRTIPVVICEPIAE